MSSVFSRVGSAAAKFAALPLPSLFLIFFAGVVLGHATLLRLPYFWDEGGYYIPAALDFYRHGSLIPEFTNAHPPLPNILIGAAWRLFGFHIFVTRLLACAAAAGALLAVLRLGRLYLPASAALTLCLLTGVYSIWYVQSSLAHADIFAALFTLWGFAVFFRSSDPLRSRVDGLDDASQTDASKATLLGLATWFTLAALSKETAILQPVALAALELSLCFSSGRNASSRRLHLRRAAALSVPLLPLIAWFAYHRLRTGFIFGNPEFLRYNATANFTLGHFASALRYRFLHLFWQRNIWLPLLMATVFLALRGHGRLQERLGLPRPAVRTTMVLVVANWAAFSVLGGALLTRYLLPIYPLLLLFCVSVWVKQTRFWPALAALTAASFVTSWWINPATFFAPEDNLTYRDMIVVHEEAIRFTALHYPEAAILTAWPVAADLVRPELGYVEHPLRVTSIDNFSLGQIRKAADEPGAFDTAIMFSTRFVPPALQASLTLRPNSRRTREYNVIRDLSPPEVAGLLRGKVVWQENRGGEWAAVLRFRRSYQANLPTPYPAVARLASRREGSPDGPASSRFSSTNASSDSP